MATLYEFTEQAKTLYELLQSDEIDEQVVQDTLEAMGVNEKLESYCMLIRQFEADAAAFKAEKERLANRQSVSENGVKRLKYRLLDYLNTTGAKKANAGTFTISKRVSQAVNVTDIAAIPQKFLKSNPTPDKTAIKKAILEGAEISGAEIVTNENIRIG